MISVVIPAYNRERTIERAIRSVLAQSYTDIEVIVVDDCSQDQTPAVVEGLMHEDPRVRFIRFDHNQGACAARNAGIDAARGEYIAFQDSDDAWRPDFIVRHLEVLRKYDADISYCKMQRHGYSPRQCPVYPDPELREGIVDYDTFATKYHASTQLLLVKREVCQEHRFDVNVKKRQDWDWCVRAARNHRVAYCEDVLVDVYLQGDSISVVQSGKKGLAVAEYLLKKYHDEFDSNPHLQLKLLLLAATNRVMIDDRSGDEFLQAYRLTKDLKLLLKHYGYKMGLYGRYLRLKEKWGK